MVHSGSDSEILQDVAEYGLEKQHIDCIFAGVAKNCLATQAWLADRRKFEISGLQVCQT